MAPRYVGCLAVSGANGDMLRKATSLGVREILVDLEDSVPSEKKDEARALVCDVLRGPEFDGIRLGLKLNDPDSVDIEADILKVVGTLSNRLDYVVLTKLGDASQVRRIEVLLSRAVPAETSIGVKTLIETPRGLANLHEILSASERLQAVAFGLNGYVREFGLSPDNDAWGNEGDRVVPTALVGYAMARVSNAAAAFGVAAIAGPSRELRDEVRYGDEARVLRQAGYSGRWALNPRQLGWAVELFSASAEAEVPAFAD